ncbi:MAG: HD-GYP domain-containing protein [Solirubrobacteraceae bacterium]
MDDDALAATRILVIGGNDDLAESVRSRLAAAGIPGVELVDDLELLVAQAGATRPQGVVCLEGVDPVAVRTRLDPLGLATGPPVVPLSDLVADGEPLGTAGIERLRLVLEHAAMGRRLAELEAIVASQALSALRDTEAIRLDTLERLGRAAEYRDDNSFEHTQRVAVLAARMARSMGQDDHMVRLIRQAAPLHDLGKIAIPDSILLKPGPLNAEELEVVRTHAVLGARVLERADSEVIGVAERIARSHHERWDGDGYPDSLTGHEIPLVARLVAVADVFDVLVHERPYKEAWTVEEAAREIRAGAGLQFDPDVVGAFDALGAAGWNAGFESS